MTEQSPFWTVKHFYDAATDVAAGGIYLTARFPGNKVFISASADRELPPRAAVHAPTWGGGPKRAPAALELSPRCVRALLRREGARFTWTQVNLALPWTSETARACPRGAGAQTHSTF